MNRIVPALCLCCGGLALGPLESAVAQSAKLTPGGASAGDAFGRALAIDAGTVLVGARGKAANRGAAYVFELSGAQQSELLALDGVAGDRFGVAVALSGERAVIGADFDADNGAGSGSAYVFDTTTGQQLFKLLPTDGAADDYFGYSVGLSGTTAIVGAFGDDDLGSRCGSAYLFDITTGLQTGKLLASDGSVDDFFGFAVAISGTRALVGAFGDDDNGSLSGSAYLFDTLTGLQFAKLLPADDADNEFGVSVAIYGGTALIGAWYDDDNGMDAGAAYVFDATTASQVHKLFPSDPAPVDYFGYAVAVDSGVALIGAFQNDDFGSGSGAAYRFDAATGVELAKLLPSDGAAGDLFGATVGIAGPIALVGAPLDADNGAGAGSAYLFHGGPVSYCTAGNSAAGCQATLSATGVASASAATGFRLIATDVEGGKDGLYFFAANGRQANAWGNGTSVQCVAPPVKRAGLLVGAGTQGACDGAFAQDLNARWQAQPAQNPGAGAVVQAQLWYRDPMNTSNQTTSLSDALEFVLAP